MSWTRVPDPTAGGGSVTINAGEPIGLLLALTYATSSVVPGTDFWTRITNPSSTSWTRISDPT